jgi:hypothetical protein
MDINDDALAAGSQRIRCLCAKGLPDVARSGSRVDPWSPASDNGEEMLLAPAADVDSDWKSNKDRHERVESW